ncbi:MAG: IS481 family transposase [Actinobacteria bacterium]|nr:IS481 family transposase [Actinomycetota bacterium]
MDLHANAAITLNQRRRLARRVVDDSWSLAEAATAAEVSERTAQKWSARYRAEGESGMFDRSSAAHRVWNRTPADRVATVVALRKLRFSGPEIAELLAMAPSTVSAVCKREGVGRLGRLGLEPARRYERSRPGELIHIDVKKLGRIDQAGHRALGRGPGRHRGKGRHGWEFVHIAIDDATRLAHAEVLADERAETAAGFLRRAVAFFRAHGFGVERLLTDNGSAYRSAVHASCCRELGIRHLRTRPYRPQTNGKAKRFIRTMLGGWAYGAIYRSSTERTRALPGWLSYYDFRRPHSAIGRKPPGARLAELLNNGPGSYTP